jgi:hypothetical protein
MSVLRGGFVFLPVTWMVFAPQLNAAHLGGSPEVIAVAVLAQPPALTGCLAGLAASGMGTVTLTILSPRIGNEKLAATAAFASSLSKAHCKPQLEATAPGRKPKRTTARR